MEECNGGVGEGGNQNTLKSPQRLSGNGPPNTIERLKRTLFHISQCGGDENQDANREPSRAGQRAKRGLVLPVEKSGQGLGQAAPPYMKPSTRDISSPGPYLLSSEFMRNVTERVE